MNIRIHIERIVLDGLSVPYHRQAELRRVVETELKRLFITKASDARPTANRVVSQMSADDLELTDEAHPFRLGRHIARAIYEGVIQ